ncbi:MAG TPA: choice-of-anchor Q domain-containing protein [Chloroflexota bacterium]|nr:choice-of-anchor Q domain-containing protein [Chloroflexota bacterium]HUM67406.1 choice-of-anchor Q domain-containing protein [Chloroflexota bacterium]
MKSPLFRVCMVYMCIILLLGYLLVSIRPLLADDAVVGDGTPASCTEVAFDAALTTAHNGGGAITFNCGGAATIVFTAVKVITANITINGADQITLSGGDTTQLFHNQAALTLQHITLTDGFSSGYRFGGVISNTGNLTLSQAAVLNSYGNYRGGGIYNNAGTAELTNVILSGNAATEGGGIWNDGGTVILTDVALSNNSADDSGGIGNNAGTVTLTNVTLSDNSARWNGGGIGNIGGGTAALTNVTLSGNSADEGEGGGMIIHDHSTVTLTNVTLSGNSARWYGGGIAMSDSNIVTLTNVTLSNNSANWSGGGIYNVQSTAVLSHVTLSGNSTITNGGGISNYSGTFALTNTTVSGNSANEGGGIYNYLGAIELTHVTLSGNSAISGGAILNLIHPDSYLMLKNSIVADSTDGGNCAGKAADEALFSLWDDESCTPTAGSGNQPNTDARLGPLADNGGPTLTHMLLPGSPTIDAGTADGAPTTDQRGLPRPVGSAPDIGAVEVQAGKYLSIYLPLVVRP